MKIEFDLQVMLDALGVASTVSPMAVTASKAAGFLFVVRGLTCAIYSRDEFCMARSTFPLTGSSGDGSFAYPAEATKALHLLTQSDSTCTLESLIEDERHIVRYSVPSGAEAERVTFDPELLFTCDEDLANAQPAGEVNSGFLREAITAAKPFLPPPKDTTVPEYTKAIQVLDKEKLPTGDGYLYVADTVRAFYFHTEAFSGINFDLHGVHLSTFLAFAAKCKGNIQIRKGSHFTFAVCLGDDGQEGAVFGWPKHAKHHEKFNRYSDDRDAYVLKVSKARMTNALQYVRMELDSTKDKVKLTFDSDQSTLQLGVVDSSSKVKTTPIPVDVEKASGSWSCSLNVNHLSELFHGLRSSQVEFRVLLLGPTDQRKSQVGMFRTVDRFYLDSTGKVTPEPEGGVACTVTRFMPSKD